MAFLPTAPSLARALAARAYTDATPVQTAVLEPEALGRDLLVSAQTGSGKTVAYGLAIGETLLGEAEFLGRPGTPLALIVAPTRELALQVQRELTWLYEFARARIVSCVGGMDPRAERRQLQDGAHIVVGTPGRLRDHLERGALNVSMLQALVLDEADEMLDLGFREDLEFILQTTPPERRTLMFSATLPKTIVALAKNYQKDALRLRTAGEERAHADIEYRAYRIASHDLVHAVVNVLRFFEPPGALVFCNTRDAVRHLHATLLERGFSAVALSGEMAQGERNHALQALRDGRARVCVATDVAGRGIDLPQLGLVIHADLPRDAEAMQHRSGRTGRAGRKGVSVLLVPPQARHHAARLFRDGRIEAIWGDVPAADAIRQRDQERFLESAILTEEPSEEDLLSARALMAQRSPEALVAALVRLHRSGLPSPEDLADPGGADARGAKPTRGRKDRLPPESQSYDPRGSRKHSDGRRSDQREETPRAREDFAPRREYPTGPRTSGPENTVWFRLDIGRQKNADPKWLLPLICRKGKVTKQDIGAIRIFDDETRFEIDVRMVDKFTAAVAKARGGDGTIELSSPPGDRPTARMVSAPADGERPTVRKGYAPREKPAPRDDGATPVQEGAAPTYTGKKPYSDKKPFKGKDFKNKDYTPPNVTHVDFKAKAITGDVAFDDKKPFEKKPFEKKPFEKKPFGDKKFGGKKFGAKKFGDNKFGEKRSFSKPEGSKPPKPAGRD